MVMRNDKISVAKKIALKFVDSTHIVRMKDRFQHLLDDIKIFESITSAEAATSVSSRAAELCRIISSQDPTMDKSAPSLDFTLDMASKELVINYRSISEPLTINYYSMDVELLFSINPFMTIDPLNVQAARSNANIQQQQQQQQQQPQYPNPLMKARAKSTTAPSKCKGPIQKKCAPASSSQTSNLAVASSNSSQNFQLIKPTRTELVHLPTDQNSIRIPIREEFKNANVMVELFAHGIFTTRSYYSH